MDSISRSGLLALLRSRSMTQEEVIKLVEMMSPVEGDGTHQSVYLGLGVQPDLLNWPTSVLAGLG